MPATKRSEPVMSEEQLEKLESVFITAFTGGDNRAELQAEVDRLTRDEWIVLRRIVLDLDVTARGYRRGLSEAQQ